jgi:hypothetical protein
VNVTTSFVFGWRIAIGVRFGPQRQRGARQQGRLARDMSSDGRRFVAEGLGGTMCQTWNRED